MNYLTAALAWLADPVNQSGADGIWARLAEHLLYTLIATGGAAAVAIRWVTRSAHRRGATWWSGLPGPPARCPPLVCSP